MKRKIIALLTVVVLGISSTVQAMANDYGMEYTEDAWMYFDPLYFPWMMPTAPQTETHPHHPGIHPGDDIAYPDVPLPELPMEHEEEDTSNYGAPFHSETKPAIRGVHAEQPKVVDWDEWYYWWGCD